MAAIVPSIIQKGYVLPRSHDLVKIRANFDYPPYSQYMSISYPGERNAHYRDSICAANNALAACIRNLFCMLIRSS